MQRNEGPLFQLQRRLVSEVELEWVSRISRRTWQKHHQFHRIPRSSKIHGSIHYALEEVVAWTETLAIGGSEQAPTFAEVR